MEFSVQDPQAASSARKGTGPAIAGPVLCGDACERIYFRLLATGVLGAAWLAFAALTFLPGVLAAPLEMAGGILLLVGTLALGRFMLATAALDTGSAFGGMGASRDMTIAALAEPAEEELASLVAEAPPMRLLGFLATL